MKNLLLFSLKLKIHKVFFSDSLKQVVFNYRRYLFLGLSLIILLHSNYILLLLYSSLSFIIHLGFLIQHSPSLPQLLGYYTVTDTYPSSAVMFALLSWVHREKYPLNNKKYIYTGCLKKKTENKGLHILVCNLIFKIKAKFKIYNFRFNEQNFRLVDKISGL